MKTHTPGPWKQNGCLIFATEARAMICELSEPRASDFIRHQRLYIGSPDWDEANANALLIAAAPELLAACQMLVKADNVEDDELNWQLVAEAMRLARAAIEKAM